MHNRKTAIALGVAGMGMAASARPAHDVVEEAGKQARETSKVYGASNIKKATRQAMKAGRITINRSKYWPHEGQREIARRKRQAERNELRQYARAQAIAMQYDGVGAAIPLGALVSRRGKLCGNIAQTA